MLQPGVCGGGGEETGIVERFAAGVVWAKWQKDVMKNKICELWTKKWIA
jgi:hypothetical protein